MRLDPNIVPIFTLTQRSTSATSALSKMAGSKSDLTCPNVTSSLASTTTNMRGSEFASEGKVSLGPSVNVPNPAGGEFVKATLKSGSPKLS